MFGSPTKTIYSWLVDHTNSGVLTQASVAIPSVTFTPPPTPAPGVSPPPVVAKIQALPAVPVIPLVMPDPIQQNQDNAFWVKIVQTAVPDKMDLSDLIGVEHLKGVKAIADLNK